MLVSRRKIKKVIDDYEKRLGGAQNVLPEEAIACHRARLVLESNTERRIRSMQTLSVLGSKAAIANAVKDLLIVSRKWPRRGVRDEELSWLLLVLLRESVTSCK